MNTRRWCKALAGLWDRRAEPAARVILDDALSMAEQTASELVDLSMSGLLQAARQARQSQEDMEILAHDTEGMPVVVHIHPERIDDEDRLSIQVRYLRHRLFQVIGEPA